MTLLYVADFEDARKGHVDLAIVDSRGGEAEIFIIGRTFYKPVTMYSKIENSKVPIYLEAIGLDLDVFRKCELNSRIKECERKIHEAFVKTMHIDETVLKELRSEMEELYQGTEIVSRKFSHFNPNQLQLFQEAAA